MWHGPGWEDLEISDEVMVDADTWLSADDDDAYAWTSYRWSAG